MSDIISRAQVLTANTSESVVAAAAICNFSKVYSSHTTEVDGNNIFKGSCIWKNFVNKDSKYEEIICYCCNMSGLIASGCQQRSNFCVAGVPAAIHTED